MKGMDIFCASQTATAIRLSMEEGEGASSSTFPFSSSGRTIDRYNPIIRDPQRFGIGKTIPSSTTTASSSSNSKKDNIMDELQKKKNKNKKSCTEASSSKSNIRAGAAAAADFDVDIVDDYHRRRGISKSWRCTTKPGDFISPPGSSRYLLSDQPKFLNVKSDFDPLLKSVPVEETSNTTAQVVLKNDDEFSHPPPPSKPIKPTPSSSSSSSSSRSQDQVVVVLRVSLHCRGCERKMRKHISRMEGVSSFNIDFAAKKVTVVGNVTPLGVLNSISKVKTAQLWNHPSNSTLLPPPPSSSIKNNSAGMMMMMIKPPPPPPPPPPLISHFHPGTLS